MFQTPRSLPRYHRYARYGGCKGHEALDEIERLIVEIETSIKNLRTVCEEQKVTLVIERVVHDMDWKWDRVCGSSSIRSLV
jgi:hypothetical protein